MDNFERGLGSMSEEDKATPFAEGMEKIYKQLMTTLDGIGVKPIEAVGQEFNPDFHNAVRRPVRTSSPKNSRKAICTVTVSCGTAW